MGRIAKIRERKAMKRRLHALRDRLAMLPRVAGGLYYWRNGIIRHAVLRPTKGWKASRVEAFAIDGITGDLTVADIDHVLKGL